MIYEIVFEPTKMLHEPSKNVPVTEITSRPMQKFFKDMVETMYVKDGVGLAAIQLGKPINVCVIAKAYNTATLNEDLCLINPSYTAFSKDKEFDEEGCLSVPGYYGQIDRSTKIKVTALDKKGKPLEFEAVDFFARIIQHEIDHLNGHLYIDRAKAIRKSDVKKIRAK